MFKKALLAFAFTVFSAQSFAGFVSVSWQSQGDNLATLHEESGKEWLDLSVTDNKSVSFVTSQLGEGGLYAGWRLPTYTEVIDMLGAFAGYDFSGATDSVTSGSAYWVSRATSFYQIFGRTALPIDSNNGITHSFGFFLDDAGVMQRGGASLRNVYGTRTGYFYGGVDLPTTTVSSTSATYGVFLVSDGGVTLSSRENPDLNINNPDAPVNQYDVSAPAIGGALIFLLGGLGCRRRR